MIKFNFKISVLAVIMSLSVIGSFAQGTHSKDKKVKHKKQATQTQLSDGRLLEENDALYQMWSLARNYHYGTTVERDAVKALAWQIIYLDALPKNYPGKAKALKLYKSGLTNKRVSEAKHYAKKLKKQYHLKFQLTEAELSRAFRLKTTQKKTSQQAGLVGQIKPIQSAEKMNILLRLKQGAGDQSPWLNHIIPLTVLANGQFYVKDLKAADYELIISGNNGEKISKTVTLSPGKIKTLAAIDFPKSHSTRAIA